MSEAAIECANLVRDFGRTRAVWDLTLKVPKGCVYGLLGRNGSGKTTTIKLLMGLLRPTRGTSRILGHDSTSLPEEVRERVGYLVEGHPLPPSWKIGRLESFTRAFHRGWDSPFFYEVLSRFDIDVRKRIWSLSRGQRGMVALALVLAAKPDVLILDDPAIGLDPVVRRAFLETMIQVIQTEGRTILFASHHLADVERVTDRIAIMENGVLRVDCPTDLFTSRVRRLEFDFQGDPAGLSRVGGVLGVDSKGPRVRLTVVHLDDAKRQKIEELGGSGFEEIPLNLEDAFVAYAGRKFGVR